MENILFGNYNNYYNRTIKRFNTWAEYNNAFNMSGYELPHYNFNPGNSLETKIIVGTTIEDMEFSRGSGPDYLIVYDDEKRILSRWFIIDINRTRGGQYELSLKRDVLADFYHDIIESPVYIEKGIIEDIESPLLLNKESLVVNQIKKQEILLKDRTKCPWLVMYIKKGVLGAGSSYSDVAINVPNNQGDVYETLATPIGQWSMYQYQNADYNVIDQFGFLVFWTKSGTVNDYQYTCKADASSTKYITGTHYTTNLTYNAATGSTFRALLDTKFKANYNNMISAVSTDAGFKSYDGIWKYDGKVIKDSDGKYYQINVRKSTYMPMGVAFIDDTHLPTLKALMTGYWNSATGQSATPNNTAFGINGAYSGYRLTISPIPSLDVTVDFSRYTGQGATDCPLYDVIAMPYGEVRSYGSGGLIDVTSSAERSMRVMSSIAKALTSNNVLDLQLLPYCPMPELINPTVDARMSIKHLNDTCVWSEESNDYGDIIYVPSKINFTFDINQQITINDTTDVPASYKVKYVNDCTLVRLCSPNYNGLFEMNLAKNNMVIDRFNVDMTLRPQNPYIHVNPNFQGLYYTDWDDARGLICGGEFSLGITDSAWNNYEIQNRNFQNIFDRQIQNMDINNSITKQEVIVGAAMGGVQGAMGGLAVGAQSGNPYVAAAGAIVGGGASTLGGILDVQNTYRRIEENRAFAIDNFNLQLGNIKALPDSITRTSALTKNNKLFPFVEIYECTDVEKAAYYNKIKYDGMTVGVIGTLMDFLGEEYYAGFSDKFFRGKLIRMPIFEDSLVISEINNELGKGVYI